ncbi:MAG: hypothetical protein HC840_04965 [Leptolyngbyaceae cyanobacterium RM2_2_4]|nr:hypothetical protein [Leptolyngbyaceae cyanobacterium RM2_2_4]
MFQAENLDVFFNEFTVEALINDRAFRVIFDYEFDELSFSAEGRDISIRMPTLDFSINQGDAVTIGQNSYRVASVRPVYDGKTTRLILRSSNDKLYNAS